MEAVLDSLWEHFHISGTSLVSLRQCVCRTFLEIVPCLCKLEFDVKVCFILLLLKERGRGDIHNVGQILVKPHFKKKKDLYLHKKRHVGLPDQVHRVL